MNKEKFDRQFQVKLAMGDTSNDRFSPTRPNTVKDALLHARKMSEEGMSPPNKREDIGSYKNQYSNPYESPQDHDVTIMKRVGDDEDDGYCDEHKQIKAH